MSGPAPPPPAAAADAATVRAVVVNYRCADDTIRCVGSLAADAPGMPVIVVDNDSRDGSAARLDAWARTVPGVSVVAADRNGGFGAGCNIGIDRALAGSQDVRHVLLVNPDAVARPGMTAALLDCARRTPRAGVVGGLVLEADGRTVWFENGAWKPWTLGASHVSAPPGRDEYETGFVTGALMLLDAGLLREGLRFDERFFLYCEDVDLCREVVARGRTLHVTRRAILEHRSGGTQADQPFVLGRLRAGQFRWITRNKVLLARKRLGPLHRCVFLTWAWTLKPLAGVLRYGTVRFLGPYYRALAEGHRVPLDRAGCDR